MSKKTYNQHKLRKAILYHRAKDLSSILQTSAVVVYLLVIRISGISEYLSHAVVRFTVPAALPLYIGIIGIPLLAILLPFSKREYDIEKRFGLSPQSRRGWWTDQLKALLLSVVLGYPLLLLLFFLFSRAPRFWWIFAAGGFLLFQLFISFLFPILVLPIFFKQRKVEDGELHEGVRRLFTEAGIALEGIYSFNLSEKTKRENALVAGLWKTRRVLIGDTLLKNRTIPQIIVVVAHEVGHHIKHHMAKLLGVSVIGTTLIFFALNSIMRLWKGFPADFETALGLLPVLILVAGLLSIPVMIGTNAYSRFKEYEADGTAIDLTRDSDAFIAVMMGLAESNLSLMHPSLLKVLLFYSHPPMGRRIEAAERHNPTGA
jgi:STE24 endopeptidase